MEEGGTLVVHVQTSVVLLSFLSYAEITAASAPECTDSVGQPAGQAQGQRGALISWSSCCCAAAVRGT